VKGVILAGGTGSRLQPLTKATNKHLLPVGKKPMILYSVQKMIESGINDIMVITGAEHVGPMISLLGSGKSYNCNFTFRVQDEPSGIAGALLLAESFTCKDKFVVILGDNIFEDSLNKPIKRFSKSLSGCYLLLKKVLDPEKYGVAIIEDNEIVGAIEKPSIPISNDCITGIYMYDASVYDIIKGIDISDRGEYEITDVNNVFIKNKNIGWEYLNGWWTDAGTHDSYRAANELITSQKIGKKHG
jgi:glucose-1-phosphate thymidylyltransferase